VAEITFIEPNDHDQVFGIRPTAKGRLSDDLWKLEGVLRERDDVNAPAVAVGGPVVVERDGEDERLPYLWRMKFLQREDGKPFAYDQAYWLFVTAEIRTGDLAGKRITDKHRLVITAPQKPVRVARIRVVEVDPAIQPGLIAATGFEAQGSSAQNHYIAGVWMNSVPANYIYDLPASTGGYWWATFPTLEPGTYTLHVIDSNNHSASVQGLVVE
jgi:hypothetical protein